MSHAIRLAAAALLAAAPFASPAAAQSTEVRVAPGQVCAQNRCVRFSRDLQEASIQARRPFSVADMGLAADPVIPFAQFRRIYLTALAQPGVNGNLR